MAGMNQEPFAAEDAEAPRNGREGRTPDEHLLDPELLNQTQGESRNGGRSLLEYLLDPKSLQALMATGGSLLMLGLVIWLWSMGVFDNPWVVAITLGTANLTVLAIGAAMVRCSRYQTAGKAMTLLACLVLPLNVWFYDAQGLVTMRDGGHLWVAAVVCCGIYAGVARLLKDPMFVYTLVAGVAMTGLLFLAEEVDRFWEVLGPATFLVVLGTLCVHAERLFREGEGPFSRRSFGRAFFRAGHIVMAVGLMVLLGGRLVGDLYEPLFAGHGWFPQPDVATDAAAKATALMLALAGAYTFLYSHIVVNPRARRYAYASVITMVWSEIILLDLLAVPRTETLWLLVLSSTGLLAFLAATCARRGLDSVGHLSRALAGVGGISTIAAVAFGMTACARGLLLPPSFWAAFDLELMFGAAMAMAAGAALLAAHRACRQSLPRVADAWAAAAALSIVAVLATFSTLVGVSSLNPVLTIAILLPVGLEVAARMGRGERVAVAGTISATMFLLALSLGAVVGLPDGGLRVTRIDHLMLAGFYAAASGVMISVAERRRTLTPAITAAVSGCAAVWQVLIVAGYVEYAPIMAASIVGLAMMVLARRRAGERAGMSTLAQAGATVVSLGSVSGLLMTLSRVSTGEAVWPLVGLAVAQGFAAGAASAVTRSNDWNAFSRMLAGLHVLVGLLVVNALSGLTLWERAEVILVAGGSMLLVTGHARWRREGEARDPIVDLHIVAGSLMASVPLMVGLIAQRFGSTSPVWGMAMFHEIGGFAVGLVLLGAGILCRLRATTFVGAGSLVTWIVSLVALVELPAIQGAAMAMMVGGGAFFTVAVLLSIYRDRLIALPAMVRNREGMFRVLDWR